MTAPPITAVGRRRPASSGRRGVLASALLGLTLLGGCSDAVSIESPDVTPGDAETCRQLVDRLPDRLAGEPRRPVAPGDALGAAWGDPAIELTCGVDVPEEYDDFASCIAVRDVGWFAPEEQLEGTDEVVLTALTHRPRVAVVVPPDHRGSDRVMAELAPVLTRTLAREDRCH